MASDDVFRPYLGCIKEYSGSRCVIYGPLGESVCCSCVVCPVYNREKTTQCNSKDFKFDFIPRLLEIFMFNL